MVELRPGEMAGFAEEVGAILEARSLTLEADYSCKTCPK